MGMVLSLHSVSDENIKKILVQPELIWRLVAPDDQDAYKKSVERNRKTGFMSWLFRSKETQKFTLRSETYYGVLVVNIPVLRTLHTG